MRKILLLASLLILLSGCTDTVVMTNDEIIAECKKCEDAGLRPSVVEQYNISGYRGVIRIECLPKKEK